MNTFLAIGSAGIAALSLVQAAHVAQAQEAVSVAPLVTLQPGPGADISPFVIDPASDPNPSAQDMTALLRQKVKYVFVIFNENHSFDNEYGTLPGVNGLYSDGQRPRPPAATPGFTQNYTDVNGGNVTLHPFRIGPERNATFVDSVDHSHKGLAKKLDVVDGVPRMDRFAEVEYQKYAKVGSNAGQAQGSQFARLVMSYIDCDTIPFYWRYASRFTIFDNIFATEDTPSTPNAVAMIAGQAGESQWVQHGPSGMTWSVSGTIEGKAYTGVGTTQGPPLVNDPNPWWGSEYDQTSGKREPTSPRESYATGNIASNLTFATVPLTALGSSVTSTTAQDLNPLFDLPDIQNDIPHIQALNHPPVEWRWYQNGYDLEPTDKDGVASHANYVAHHSGPQYFGYLANNPSLAEHLRGEGDFFADISAGKLPASGGIFYIRGGFSGIKGETPPIQNPRYPNPAGLPQAELDTIKAGKSGDDDHPGYTDRQISEAMNARVINAIASNPEIWSRSAIIITYDESDGFYDHVPPRILSYGPDGLPLARGVRVPLLLISPFARAHAVSHAEGDHNAVIETINAVFDLPPLSQLPDEAQALAKGDSPDFNRFGRPGFRQLFLGPRDTNSPITDSLLSGFDPARLRGTAPPLPASYAMIPDEIVNALPHFGGKGCEAIGMTPEDRRQGITNEVPDNFNTLPATLPAYN
jgi:phospholipase C